MGAAGDHAPDRQENLSAPEHHPAVKSAVRSAVEESIRRYGETEPRIHAFVHYDAEPSLLLDAALGVTGATGALLRTPIAVKDIVDTAGAPTERGSALYAGRIAERDAEVVRNLRAAGAIIVGKTVTAELAFYHPGPTLNPWNPTRTPGGSSMGSAAAVAAGVVPMAVGTQTNGSIIRPAAFCGVVGFKPTTGRLSREGVFEFSRTLDHVGGFARSVHNVARLIAAMAGEDLARWWSGDSTTPKLAALLTSEWDRADEAARDRFQADVDRLAAAGGPVEWPTPPDGLDEAPALLRTIMLFEAARRLAGDLRGREHLVSATARRAFEEGAAITESAYAAAVRARDGMVAAFATWATPYDAILTPAALGEAPTPETTGDPRFCTRWSLIGAPAIVIPSDLGPNRLPLGLQLVAAPGDDRRLIAAAAWCEATLPWIGAPPL
jgi:Asp-tRNA(Asn)/Glu-tRNA(Gln) amidotransferase A subunit family amidase